MINLNNDVLNKERRILFPKLYTLNNKLSLSTLTFLKKQNPFKFYRSFYYKHIKKEELKNYKINYNKAHNKKVPFLSILSKTQNNFFSLPIKYDSSLENKIRKDNDEIKYINFIKNKNLKNLHNKLLLENNMNNVDIFMNKNKIFRNKKLKTGKSKSCGEIIFLENFKNKNNLNNNNNIRANIKNNVSTSHKKSIDKDQQTIENDCLLNNNYKYNNININGGGQKLIESYKYNRYIYDIQNNYKNKNKYFFNWKNNFKNDELDMNNNINNKIKIFWSKLRRPIILEYN